jgi:trigger factor
MQIETVSTLERRVELAIPMQQVAQEVEARLKRLSKSVKMQGFRPGKVPLKIVAQNYGFRVQNDVMTERINDQLRRLLETNQLRIAGSPRVEAQAEQPSDTSDVRFVATFEIYPDIRFGDWKSVEVERATLDVTEVEIDKTIEILRKQRQTYETVERAAQADDRVSCDFVGRIDGVEFDGGKAEDFEFVIGGEQMLPEFEEAVVGLKAGESKTFPLTFPADYHGIDVAGKTAEFTLTLKKASAPKLPALDAEFAIQMGVKDGNLDKMREEVKANLTREVSNRLKLRTKQNVMDAILKVAEFELPKSLIEQDTQRLRETTLADLKQRGMNSEGFDLPDGLFKAQAERRVRLGLAVDELVNRNNLNASSDQVRVHIEEFAKSYEDPASVMAWYFGDRQRLSEVETLVLEDNLMDWVLSQVSLRDKPVIFDELMGTPF